MKETLDDFLRKRIQAHLSAAQSAKEREAQIFQRGIANGYIGALNVIVAWNIDRSFLCVPVPRTTDADVDTLVPLFAPDEECV